MSFSHPVILIPPRVQLTCWLAIYNKHHTSQPSKHSAMAIGFHNLIFNYQGILNIQNKIADTEIYKMADIKILNMADIPY